jgi:hypothetical protein
VAETIVFFAKYTTLVQGTYYSDPFEVTGFKDIAAQTMLAAVVGSGTISAQMQQSSDLITWSNFGSAMEPTAGNITTEVEPDPARYIRLVVTAGGAGSGVITFWAKAVAREA